MGQLGQGKLILGSNSGYNRATIKNCSVVAGYFFNTSSCKANNLLRYFASSGVIFGGSLAAKVASFCALANFALAAAKSSDGTVLAPASISLATALKSDGGMGAAGGGDTGGMGLLGSTVSPGQRPLMGFGIDLSGHSTTAGLLSADGGALLSAAGGGGVSVVCGGHAGLSGVKPQSTTTGGLLSGGADAGGGVSVV
jgi:hypothetical protein